MKVWDLHCDTLYELRRAEKAGAPKSFLHNDLHIDLEKLQQGDYLLQCFAAYVDLADPASGADPLVSVLEEIDIFKRLMAAYPEKIAPVYTAADLERNRAEGKLSAMLTVEEGGCCKGSLGVLRRLQELGVRMMTLTWNYPNELAAPNANPGGPLVEMCIRDSLCAAGRGRADRRRGRLQGRAHPQRADAGKDPRKRPAQRCRPSAGKVI